MDKNKWTNIGYRCGQIFACTCLMCLLVIAVAVEMFKKLTLHCQQWNRWQKHSLNSRFHKILVLLKLRRSPSFEMMKVGEQIAANTVSIFGKLTKALDSSAKSFAEFNDIVCATLEKGVKK